MVQIQNHLVHSFFYFKRGELQSENTFFQFIFPQFRLCVHVAAEQQRAARKWESVLHHHPPLHTKRSFCGVPLHFCVFLVNNAHLVAQNVKINLIPVSTCTPYQCMIAFV